MSVVDIAITTILAIIFLELGGHLAHDAAQDPGVRSLTYEVHCDPDTRSKPART